jgi:glycosyltransferase involved in cell wall biosynthesis
MSIKGLVSVVITCYNYGRFLPFAVESVLEQTYPNFEIIVVNDGSTDNTDDAIQRYLQNTRLKYIRQKNGGQANAKNTGIRASVGEFVAFLDADDLWVREKLERQLNRFSDSGTGVVYSGASFIDEEGRAAEFSSIPPREGSITQHLFFDNCVWFSSSIVRRSSLEESGGFDETLSMGIDWDLWLRISVRFRFAYVDAPLILYRVGHSGQMSRNMEERQRCSDRIMHSFMQRFPGMLSESTIRRARAYNYCNRGRYFGALNKNRSNRLYFKALATDWRFGLEALKGLARNLLS